MGAIYAALAVIVPVAGLILALSGPVSRLLFGYGAASEDIDLVAITVAAFVPGIVGFTTTYLVQRAFYAQEDTRTPVLVQLIVSVVQVGLSLALVTRLDPVYVSAGLAASWSVAVLVGAVFSLSLLSRRVGRVGGWRFTGRLVVVTAAALPGSLLVLWGVVRGAELTLTSSIGALAAIAVGSGVAVAVYVALAWLVRVGPVRDAASWAVARVRRGG